MHYAVYMYIRLSIKKVLYIERKKFDLLKSGLPAHRQPDFFLFKVIK